MATKNSKKLHPAIQGWVDLVQGNEHRTCEDQKLLVKHILQCFQTEDIFVNEEQLDHYLGQAKYFPYEELFLWEKFIIALHDCTYWRATGMPRWPDLFCMIGRGAGKDGVAAFESHCLISPYNPIPHYDVDICANNEDQALRPVTDVIEAYERPENIKKLRRFFYWNKESVRCLKTKSVIKGRTNNPKGKDGLRSGAVIFNEIHQYTDYKNISVFTTGLGKKPHPRRSYYTTNGDVREGPLDDILKTADEILRSDANDNGLLPFICRLDSKEEVHDEANWEKANPTVNYNESLLQEIRKEYREWKEHPERNPAFMTKRMNIPQAFEDVTVTDYENIKITNRPIPAVITRWECTVGIDYAKLTDFAAVNVHFKDNDRRYDINRAWICTSSKSIPRLKIPWRQWGEDGKLGIVDDVEIHPGIIGDYIREIAKEYKVRMVALDDYRYSLLSDVLWEIGFSAKDKKNVKLVRPSDIMKVVPVIDSCFANQYFYWGDDPVLRWAANNTKLVPMKKTTSGSGRDYGNYVYDKIEPKSRKNDPFMALVASMCVEDVLKGQRAAPPSSIKVYSF